MGNRQMRKYANEKIKCICDLLTINQKPKTKNPLCVTSLSHILCGKKHVREANTKISLYQMHLHCHPDQARRILHSEFGQQVFAVGIHRGAADEKPPGNIIIGHPFSNQFKYF